MGQPDIMIRQVTADDVEVLSLLIRKGFEDVAAKFGLNAENCPKHPSNYTMDWVLTDLERGVLYFIEEDDGEPVGCVGLEDAGEGIFYLERIAVLPEYRGRGLGRALLNHAVSQARKLGCRRVEIGIISDDVSLMEWYSRAGFEVTGRKRFEHLPFEVTFMARDIHQDS
ncbi:MAG: GNAT family N-acetyltransferase [Theionarchaea archaeon]|nr:GNAT family N-acetyltransferase [Theionarchaea archaeon]